MSEYVKMSEQQVKLPEREILLELQVILSEHVKLFEQHQMVDEHITLSDTLCLLLRFGKQSARERVGVGWGWGDSSVQFSSEHFVISSEKFHLWYHSIIVK